MIEHHTSDELRRGAGRHGARGRGAKRTRAGDRALAPPVAGRARVAAPGDGPRNLPGDRPLHPAGFRHRLGDPRAQPRRDRAALRRPDATSRPAHDARPAPQHRRVRCRGDAHRRLRMGDGRCASTRCTCATRASAPPSPRPDRSRISSSPRSSRSRCAWSCIGAAIDPRGFDTLAQFTVEGVLFGVLLQGFLVNIALFVFNALPLPGLDGYAVVRSLLFGRSPGSSCMSSSTGTRCTRPLRSQRCSHPSSHSGGVNPIAAMTIGAASLDLRASDRARGHADLRRSAERVHAVLMSAVMIDGVEWPRRGRAGGDRAARARAPPVPAVATGLGASRRSLRPRRGSRCDGGARGRRRRPGTSCASPASSACIRGKGCAPPVMWSTSARSSAARRDAASKSWALRMRAPDRCRAPCFPGSASAFATRSTSRPARKPVHRVQPVTIRHVLGFATAWMHTPDRQAARVADDDGAALHREPRPRRRRVRALHQRHRVGRASSSSSASGATGSLLAALGTSLPETVVPDRRACDSLTGRRLGRDRRRARLAVSAADTRRRRDRMAVRGARRSAPPGDRSTTGTSRPRACSSWRSASRCSRAHFLPGRGSSSGSACCSATSDTSSRRLRGERGR